MAVVVIVTKVDIGEPIAFVCVERSTGGVPAEKIELDGTDVLAEVSAVVASVESDVSGVLAVTKLVVWEVNVITPMVVESVTTTGVAALRRVVPLIVSVFRLYVARVCGVPLTVVVRKGAVTEIVVILPVDVVVAREVDTGTVIVEMGNMVVETETDSAITSDVSPLPLVRAFVVYGMFDVEREVLSNVLRDILERILLSRRDRISEFGL